MVSTGDVVWVVTSDYYDENYADIVQVICATKEEALKSAEMYRGKESKYGTTGEVVVKPYRLGRHDHEPGEVTIPAREGDDGEQ